MELSELKRLERRMTFVRWFGFAFGLLAIGVPPGLSVAQTQRLAIFLLACLGAGNIALSVALRRAKTRPFQARLGALAYVFDAAIVLALVWVFAAEQPYVVWALLLLLPMEGALRYRLFGALASAIGVAVFFVFQSLHRVELVGGSFDYDTYAFVVGSAVLVAGVTGSMAENWHTQNRAFRQQSLALAEIDELKDRFLAITSHEIRGPLTAIIAGIDTVWRRGHRLTNEQRERLLEMVSRQSHHVARLVDDLLTTSQLQAGKLTLQLDWAELAPAFESALESASAKRRSHQLEVDIDPLQARLDSARVEQIVRNLVENAYKYTPDRTRVRVAGRSGPEGVVIEVADDGEGIPEDKREYLFQAFTRIEATTAGKDGVGLGLYVVSQLVAAMDGHIDMTSSSSGTTFLIHLPCAVRPADERQVEVARDPAQAHA